MQLNLSKSKGSVENFRPRTEGPAEQKIPPDGEEGCEKSLFSNNA